MASHYAEVAKQSDEDKARRVSDASKAEDLDKATRDEFREGIRSSGQRRLDELGLEIAFDLDDPRVIQFIAEESSNQIVGINNRTKKLVRATLREGFENGESVNKLARRIRGVYADAQGRRSLVIARTESVRALNSGQVAATAQAGFEGKQWLSTQDPRVRDTHAIGTGMDGQIVGVNGDFVSPSGAVGPFPGAMSTAAESINCRCTTLSIAKLPKESLGDEVVWPPNLNTEERRQQVWRAAERIRIPIERRLRRAFRTGFTEQERDVLRALREVERLAALALHNERTEPMKDKDQFQVFTGRRLWTGERSARKLLIETPEELEGVLLQHPRIADVTEVKGGGGGGGDDDKKPRRRLFRISTETKDRHGDVIRSKGIQLKNFRKNPVVLFAHDARQPPIGKSTKIERGDGILDAEVEFFERDVFEFADTIFRIVQAGGLKAASIGFIPLDFGRLDDETGASEDRFPGIEFKKIDLLEFSIVPIPANPEAVARALSDGAAMEPYLAWLDDVQDNWADVEELFAGLGATADDVMAVRRAADGGKTAVQTKPFADGGVIKPKDAPLVGDQSSSCFPLTAEMQDRLARGNLARIAGSERDESEGATDKLGEDPSRDKDSAKQFLQSLFTMDSLGAVTISSEPPELLEFSRELVEHEDSLVSLEDGILVVEVDNARLEYSVVEENDDTITGELSKLIDKAPITFQAAHPDGTPAQGRDVAWSASREVREASVDDLLVMSAWRESKPRDDLVKRDFKFPHHVSSGQHAVNFRASTAGIAVLNGARGGANIPDGDRRGVWRHLARHIREDFDSEPPELRWIETEPLKTYPDLFVYDYEEGKLLAWFDGQLIDAKHVEVLEDSRDNRGGEFPAIVLRADVTDGEQVKQDGFVIQTIAGRKSKWKSKEAFLEWAKDHDFRTDKVDTTRNFWRLRQQDPDEFERLRTICINPNDVEASSSDCKVQAIGGPLKQAEASEEEISRADAEILEAYVDRKIKERSKDVYNKLRDISLGYRASLIAEGSYGAELWDEAVDRLISPRSFFRVVKGEAVDLGEDQLENMEKLEDERLFFARFIMDRRREDSLGRARVLGTEDAKDMRGFAEATARHIVEINEDPDQIVVVGRAIGRLDDEAVFEDCAAFRWVSTGLIVRISLGEEFSDPIAQVHEMANAIHEGSRAMSSPDEYRLRDVVRLLTEVLERSKEKEQEAPEPETAEDVIAALVEEDSESDGDDESEKDDDAILSQVDAEELREVLGENIREKVSEIVRDSARGRVQKETGTID